MMFVVGTDHGGSGHTGWQDNLALAARLQKSLSGDCSTLMRDINLRSASFNAQYTSGSLLVEIGSCASTLDEAKNAAELFADHLAREILGN
jgi:stage II sporulation protein P